MKYFIILFSVICFLSCDPIPPPECHDTPPFSELKSHSIAYQSAVIQMLESSDPNEFRYFFKTFSASGDDTFMTLNFRNESKCFDVQMLVEKWDKLEGMRKVNGQSYPKELHNLKWTIEEVRGYKMLVYQDMDVIRD